MSELRWHPLLQTWVIVATHRQDRTYHPPAGFCPLCPTKPGEFETEIPVPDYDIAVFENKFPSLQPSAPVDLTGDSVLRVLQGHGVCEVICYSSQHDATFATLPLSQIRKLTRVWQERYNQLSELPGIEYVYIFENKGDVIGVTLSHPHGQIYAYPFVPPTIQSKLSSQLRHFEETGRSLIDDWIEAERDAGDRIITENPSFIALVPHFARYPYEVHVVTLCQRPSLKQLSSDELDGLAEILHDITNRYDRLFGFSMPYVMAFFQAPVNGAADYLRFHVEFYPPHRTAEKLKHLAGSEAGAGTFINDVRPEDAAARLRNV